MLAAMGILCDSRLDAVLGEFLEGNKREQRPQHDYSLARFGLNEAAREAIKKFKFRAAIKGGEAVSTTMVYNYTFLLD